MKKILLIIIILGAAFFAYLIFGGKKADQVTNKGEVNIFANVDFSHLLPSNRSEEQAGNVTKQDSSEQLTSSTNNKDLATAKTNIVSTPTANANSANYPTPKYTSINVQNLGQMLAPDNTASLLGQMLSQSQNAIKLIDLKEQIEALYPKPEKGDVKLSRALNQQGLAKFSKENYPEAANLFLDANKANPADIEVLNNYAYALLKSGNNQLAQQVLGYVLSIAPGRTSAWANLGEVYANLNREDAAAASFVVAFQFSTDKEKTIVFFRTKSDSSNNQVLKNAIAKALAQLSSS